VVSFLLAFSPKTYMHFSPYMLATCIAHTILPDFILFGKKEHVMKLMTMQSSSTSYYFILPQSKYSLFEHLDAIH
jgi:hypothetical protein